MSRINYVPFARRQRLTVPGNTAGTPGRNFTRLADLRPGACKRAHILDAIIWQSDGGGKSGNWGDSLKMRYGINGKNYFTSEFFDYRAFQSGHMPLISCWTGPATRSTAVVGTRTGSTRASRCASWSSTRPRRCRGATVSCPRRPSTASRCAVELPSSCRRRWRRHRRSRPVWCRPWRRSFRRRT